MISQTQVPRRYHACVLFDEAEHLEDHRGRQGQGQRQDVEEGAEGGQGGEARTSAARAARAGRCRAPAQETRQVAVAPEPERPNQTVKTPQIVPSVLSEALFRVTAHRPLTAE